MKKTWIAILVVLTLAMTLAGCGVKKVSNINDSDQVEDDVDNGDGGDEDDLTGGWEIVEDPAAVELPADAKKVFDSYVKDFGEGIIPMGYIARKNQDGMHYMILCKDTDADELQTVVLSDSSGEDGDDSIIYSLYLDEYTEGKGAEIKTERAADDWEVPEDFTKGTLPDKVKAPYDKAVAKLTVNNMTPIAYLGSQLVSGTNYAILVRSETTAENSVAVLQVVIVYEDLEGNAEITNTYTLDLSELGD